MSRTELPRGWQWKTIGEVCRVIPGFAFKSKDWADSGIPVIKIKNIKSDCTIDTSNTDCVPPEVVSEKMGKFRLRKGDILIAMTGATAGKVGWLSSDREFLLNQRVAKLDPVDIERRFFWGIISGRRYQDLFFHLADGAAQPNMSGKQIENVEIPVPPHQVQLHLASIVSTYDDLIENNTRRIEILEEMARRLYEEWFVHFRFPGHEEASFKESDFGEIPESWNIVKLESLCSKITDGAHKSPPSVEDGMPMASVKDMHNWGFYVPGCRKISKEDYNALVRGSCKPEVYDILIAKDGANLNKHTFLVVDEQELVLLSSVAIIRPRDEVEPEFLVSQLKSEEVSERIKLSKSGAAIPRIVLKDFKRLDILLPPREIQARWKQNAKPLADMCRLLTRKNENLRAQRDLLLPKLVSGEIDVSDIPMPDDRGVEAA